MSGRRKLTPGIVRFVCIDRYHDKLPHRTAVAKLGDAGLEPLSGVKERERPEGGTVWEIRCKCGLHQQRASAELASIAAGVFAANPDATRIDLEISGLRGAVPGRGGRAT